MEPSFLLLSTAFVISAISAPLMARLALRLHIVDSPDQHRKLHKRSMPLTGGPTLLFSGVVTVTIACLFFPDILKDGPRDTAFLITLFFASLVIVGVGLLDDRFAIRGRQKLLGQLVAAMIMLLADITITKVRFFGIEIHFGHFGPLVTVAWLLCAINALNLIDGVDGLASTTGIVLSLSIAAVTLVLGGRPDGFLVAIVLTGSLSGFLIYNFPPAKMFLGDSGSMFIGLVLGSIALKASLKGYTATALIMPTAIWAIPIFDVSMAIIRRKLTGRSIYTTDRSHLHHCLERKGHSRSQVLLVVGSLCAMTGIGAIVGSVIDNELVTLVVVLTAISLLVLTRSFGHTEMCLIRNRCVRLASSMIRRHPAGESSVNDEQVHLNGNHDWERLWSTLTEFAERFEMDHVELMVSLPLIGEEYHARWRRNSSVEDHEAWKSEIPLIINRMHVGYIRVEGTVGDGSICEWMSDLIGGLRSFEEELVSLIHELRLQRGISVESTPVSVTEPEPQIV
ncbi:MAG: undecaprenyl/decaprenyl-phosphate alpha-N-acetylglucosaminyl 1-phosphate transferase [Fuerstiella sp.]|nr:undecaprenyl/decaprenyl-phosphate alpha-N-acetylglucosaminyl 1-phosphate transferase [Fuerstiella sp.]